MIDPDIARETFPLEMKLNTFDFKLRSLELKRVFLPLRSQGNRLQLVKMFAELLLKIQIQAQRLRAISRSQSTNPKRLNRTGGHVARNKRVDFAFCRFAHFQAVPALQEIGGRGNIHRLLVAPTPFLPERFPGSGFKFSVRDQILFQIGFLQTFHFQIAELQRVLRSGVLVNTELAVPLSEKLIMRKRQKFFFRNLHKSAD